MNPNYTLVALPDGLRAYPKERYNIDVIDNGRNLVVTDRVDRSTIAAYQAPNAWTPAGQTEVGPNIIPCPDPGCHQLVCIDCGEHLNSYA